MVLFGYKTSSSSVIRALCAIAVGALLILMPDGGSKLLVQIAAGLIFAAGLVSLTVALYARSKMEKPTGVTLGEINAGIIIMIGLLFLVFPGILTKLIVIIIGIILIVFGGLQLIVLGGAVGLLGLGYGILIFSFLAFAGGILLLFSPFAEDIMSIIAGSLLAYYGITELLCIKRVSDARAKAATSDKPNEDAPGQIEESKNLDGVKDAEFEKVDEQ